VRATYRVQLGPGFGFEELSATLDYLTGLGVSHLYCSPILQAAQGSSHGYDVVDPTRISDDLGGEGGFRALVDAARGRGLRILLDIVPNHMSVSDRRNRWWWDVLVAGRSSPFARYFDINWDHPLFRGRVMAPLLDRSLDEALEQRLVRLVVDSGVVVAHGESRLPLSRETLPTVLAGTGLASPSGSATRSSPRSGWPPATRWRSGSRRTGRPRPRA
jgi:(1->4)-alpha-D-glucan 1-alpha-D-glucosylmutase